jgi:hypothetical protein
MQDAFALRATFFLQKPVDTQKLSVLLRTVSGGMQEPTQIYLRANSDRCPCTVGPRAIRGVCWNLSQERLIPVGLQQLACLQFLSYANVVSSVNVASSYDTQASQCRNPADRLC